MPRSSTRIIAKKAAPKKASGIASPVTSASFRGKPGAEKSVDIRQIENGYIIRESACDAKGRYKSVERFSEKAPTIQLGAPKARK